MGDYFVISIGRQYGCGGQEIGRLLSEKLQIGFYDKAILKMTSDRSGIRESYFHLADERAGGSILGRIVNGLLKKQSEEPSLNGNELLKPDNLFRFQSEVIKNLAEGQSFVIMGRCADMVLKDHPNLVRIYIYADMEYRIQHVKQEGLFPVGEEQKNIRRMDKERNEYYRYYTGASWGDVSRYDLMLDSSKIGIEGAAEVILALVRARGYIS